MNEWLDKWTNGKRLNQQELAKRWATRNDPPPPSAEPSRPAPKPPYWQTMRFLKNAEWRTWRPLRADEPIPIRYSDPKQQEAFERVFADRKHILRVP